MRRSVVAAVAVLLYCALPLAEAQDPSSIVGSSPLYGLSGATGWINSPPLNAKQLKGKVVLVDFWATWCGPCIAELPNLEAAYKKYNPKGFEVIGVSLDKPGDDEKLTKFMENRKMPWGCINIEDSRKLADKYQVNAIPYPVLIGADGRIVSLRGRGPTLERLLDRMLKDKK